MKRRPIVGALAATVLAGCGSAGEAPLQVPTSAPLSSQPAKTTARAEPGASTQQSASTTPEIEPCRATAASLSLAEQVGQLYMVGVSTQGLDDATREVIENYHIGAVVLLGQHTAGAAPIAQLTDAVATLDSPIPIVVAVDQEGGAVQRLQGNGFSDIPSAFDQARGGAEQLSADARTWGQELHDVGIDWNLAPVADVVPAPRQDTNAPIGQLKRNYGNEIPVVAQSVAAYVHGMDSAGIATSLKHFPGLGFTEGNTDHQVVHDTTVVPDDPAWESFRVGIDAGASSVMISSAFFENLDPANEGVFSATIITDLLRDKLSFDGLVIADDLGAAVAVADIDPAERGNRFFAAGGDVAINADPQLMGQMATATVERAETDSAFAAQLTRSVTRVLELKQQLGLMSC